MGPFYDEEYMGSFCKHCSTFCKHNLIQLNHNSLKDKQNKVNKQSFHNNPVQPVLFNKYKNIK